MDQLEVPTATELSQQGIPQACNQVLVPHVTVTARGPPLAYVERALSNSCHLW